MNPTENNFAYIDGANLYEGAKSLGLKLDYSRFKTWLKEKHSAKSSDCCFAK